MCDVPVQRQVVRTWARQETAGFMTSAPNWLHLITKEEIILIIHLHQTLKFFDDPEVPFGPQGPQPPELPGPHQPARPQDSPGIPPTWRPAPSKEVVKELKQTIPRVDDYTRIRDLLRLCRNSFQYQWMMAKIMMISHHRERQKQRLDCVYPHVPVAQEPQIQPMVTPESDDEISDEDFPIVDSSPP